MEGFPRIYFIQIETVSGTLVLRWVNSQLARISAWVERVMQQEVGINTYKHSCTGH